jgi:coenzyme F420-reducing hydrogenase alpha subunit
MSGGTKIDILTRVEGHGSVELIREGNRIVDARLRLHESPRLFEALLVGRNCDELAEIACRICSICSTVHKVVALQAVEQALEIRISHQTGLLRELAVQGGQIESHALHIFCLALPDYLGAGGFPGLATVAPRELQMGLRIKALGNLIQETVGGRAIHPFNLLIGGVGTVPTNEQLHRLADQLATIYEDTTATIALIAGLRESLQPIPALPACAVAGGPPLFGDHLETSTGSVISADSAVDWLNEKIEAHTHAKVSRFDGSSIFMVGPLARLTLNMPPDGKIQFNTALLSSSLPARAVELQQAVRRAILLVDRLLREELHPEQRAVVAPHAGTGTALIEAPRGSLLHSYTLDEKGICRAVNIITPTAINQAAIEQSLKILVTTMDGADYDQIKNAAECLIRCFDPCISCAVH